MCTQSSTSSKYLKSSRNPFIGFDFSENLRLILLLALKFIKLLKWCKSRGLRPWRTIIWSYLTKYFSNYVDCFHCHHHVWPGIVTVKTNFFLYHNIMKCVSKIPISNLLCCGKTDSRLQVCYHFYHSHFTHNLNLNSRIIYSTRQLKAGKMFVLTQKSS